MLPAGPCADKATSDLADRADNGAASVPDIEGISGSAVGWADSLEPGVFETLSSCQSHGMSVLAGSQLNPSFVKTAASSRHW